MFKVFFFPTYSFLTSYFPFCNFLFCSYLTMSCKFVDCIPSFPFNMAFWFVPSFTCISFLLFCISGESKTRCCILLWSLIDPAFFILMYFLFIHSCLMFFFHSFLPIPCFPFLLFYVLVLLLMTRFLYFNVFSFITSPLRDVLLIYLSFVFPFLLFCISGESKSHSCIFL